MLEKLKTLKDLKNDDWKESYDFEWVDTDELKQEAIKWVKERIRGCCGIPELLEICEEHRFWMDRFNITEEDLQ